MIAVMQASSIQVNKIAQRQHFLIRDFTQALAQLSFIRQRFLDKQTHWMFIVLLYFTWQILSMFATNRMREELLYIKER